MLHHLTWSSAGRATLFPDEAHRRLAVRTIARVAGEETGLFCLVDDHLHLVATDDEAIRTAGPARLVAAAASVLATGPDLSGKAAERVLARRAAACLAAARPHPRRRPQTTIPTAPATHSHPNTHPPRL